MYQFQDIRPAGGGAIAHEPGFRRQTIARGFGRKGEPARRALGDVELVVDLGVRIGSRQWFRGAATCVGLCAIAWMLAPTAQAMPGGAPNPLPSAQRAEARALAFAPLALGAGTGKRMAPTDAVEPLAVAPERPRIELSATLNDGNALAQVLAARGADPADAASVAELVGAEVPLETIRPGTVVNIVLGRRANPNMPRPIESIAFRASLDLRLTVSRAGGAFAVSRTDISIDETPLRIQGQVGASLYRSARAAGVPGRAVQAYIRALTTQIDIGDLNSSDRFDIVIEHRRAATGESESGQLLYAGLDRARGRDLQLMQWTIGGEAQWFEASGVGRSTGGLTQPVPGRMSSGYGYRTHPILGYRRFHRGLDIAARSGTPILAPTDGQVARAGWGGGYGNVVELRHAGGLSTRFGHMSRIAVSGGQRVRQGQVIGYVGSTGLSTGPHLHYEMYRNGQLIDPRSVRFASRSQLEGRELAGFRTRLRSYLALSVGAPAQPGATPVRNAP